jgi:deoxyribodipyrimidine photo-lyase
VEWKVKTKPELVDWKATIDEALERGKAVPEVEWCIPGEKAAAKVRHP